MPDNMEVWGRGVCLGSDATATAATVITEIVKSECLAGQFCGMTWFVCMGIGFPDLSLTRISSSRLTNNCTAHVVIL